MTITKSKSLTGLIRLSISFVFFVMAGFIAYLWVADEIKTTRAAIASLRTDYIDAQKETIKTQVRQAVEYVWYKKSSTEKRVRKEVKARTYEAYETARYIYEKNKDRLTLEQIKKLVHDALFPAA